jgi:hypothetical protein
MEVKVKIRLCHVYVGVQNIIVKSRVERKVVTKTGYRTVEVRGYGMLNAQS